MVAFLDGEHEERIALVDPVLREPLEERRERRVVVLQLLDVVGLSGPRVAWISPATPCWSCVSEM